MRKSKKPKVRQEPRTHEECWEESAFWGATVFILLLLLVFAGVGYVGYTSLERPRQQAAVSHPATPPPATAVAAAQQAPRTSRGE